MSRLHAVAATAAEVAAHFRADPADGVEVPLETVEGLPGLVVFESGGRRHLRNMTRGFPRFARALHTRDEEPGRIGLVADLTNPMWDEMVVEPRYRCLIPITHFATPTERLARRPGRGSRWRTSRSSPGRGSAATFRTKGPSTPE